MSDSGNNPEDEATLQSIISDFCNGMAEEERDAFSHCLDKLIQNKYYLYQCEQTRNIALLESLVEVKCHSVMLTPSHNKKYFHKAKKWQNSNPNAAYKRIDDLLKRMILATLAEYEVAVSQISYGMATILQNMLKLDNYENIVPMNRTCMGYNIVGELTLKDGSIIPLPDE